MISINDQKNHARQLLSLTLATAMLTSVFAVTSYSGTRSRSSGVAKTNRAASPLTQPQTTALRENGKIAFVSYRDGNAEIYTMNPNGSNQTNITNNPANDNFLGWSPDGTKIFFSNDRDLDGPGELYVMEADGSNQTNLTNNPADDFGFAWSLDRTKIAFSSNRDGNYEIYVMNADGRNKTRLTNNALNDFFPQWFPDGARIIFVRSSQIYTMNADGTNQTNLTSRTTDDNQPTVSPDGTRIAFVHLVQAGNNGLRELKNIYLMNADGSNQTMLTNGYSDYDPHWSPDGTKIFFTRLDCLLDVCGVGSYAMNADGSGQMQTDLPPGPLSPDGTKVAYTSFEFVEYPDYAFSDISVANADGSNPRRITNSGDNSDPSWQPVSAPLTPAPNPIEEAEYFVQEHYRDFLDRSADAGGLAFWTNEITECGTNSECIEAKRSNVSAAFYLSIEFQQTGYLVYRIYKASYGNLPGAPVPIKRSEFLPDTQQIGQGVIVNQTGWKRMLENNQQAFTAEFVQRTRFTSAYPTSMTPDVFVDTLFANAGVTPSESDRTEAINEFAFAPTTADLAGRARALRRVAENATLAQQEFNRAFVLMQYFGYLRRNPNDPPEATLDFRGYNFWLNKLNGFNGNFINAEMVKAFITSGEYRQRFGPP